MNSRIKFVICSNKFIILSFKFVKYGSLYLGDDFERNYDKNYCQYTKLVLLSRAQLLWPTNLKCNWRKRRWIDKARNWMTIYISKLIDQKRNWNEHSHIPECPVQNWKQIKKNWIKRWRKWAGKPILSENWFSFKHSSKFLFLSCL